MTARYNYGLEYSKAAVFSTTLNYIEGPATLVRELTARISSGRTVEYNEKKKVYVVMCDDVSGFPDVFLKVGGQWLQIKAADYLMEVDNTCFIGIVPKSQGHWTFGLPMLNGYYTVFDNSGEDAKIGFAPSTNSDKIDVVSTGMPQSYGVDLLWEFTWIFDIYTMFGITGLYDFFQYIGIIYVDLSGVF